jgi:hypothetical protein
MTADKRLEAAHARVANSKSALGAATAAAEKARGHLADVGLEVVAHLRRHEEAAASRAAARGHHRRCGSESASLPDRLGVIDLAIKALIGAETGEPSP